MVSDSFDGVVWFNTCFICYFSSDCKNNRLDKLRINSIACKSYLNADTQKESLIADQRRKSGIYKWTNKLNGKVYIGSSVNLSKRLSNYYNYNNLIKFQQNMLIHKALLKYGYSNFSLEILEYCEPSDVIKREQYYIDKLNPEYNLHPTAGSPFGYKHTEATLAKFKNRVMTAKHKALLVKHLKKLANTEEHKERGRLQMIKLNKLKGFSIQVIDTKTQETTIYPSLREAARTIGCSHCSISYVIKNFPEKGVNKLLKKRYFIKVNETVGESGVVAAAAAKSEQHMRNIPEELKGTSIEVLDLETEKYSNYASISATANAIGCSSTSIRSVIKLFKEKGINRPIKKRYLIKIV